MTHIEDDMVRNCKRWKWRPYLLTEHFGSFDVIMSPVLPYPLPYSTELDTVLASWIYNHHETNDLFPDVSLAVNLQSSIAAAANVHISELNQTILGILVTKPLHAIL